MIIKTAAEVKGLKRLHEEAIEAGEEYCFPLPRYLGGNWDEQMYSTAIAEHRIEKSGVIFMPYIMMTDLAKMIENSLLPQD